jgi:uncharacterized membrane protein
MTKTIETTLTQNIFRILLSILWSMQDSVILLLRVDFQAQVPDWLPLSKDLVLLSGIVEIALGLGLAFWKKERVTFGWVLALFSF